MKTTIFSSLAFGFITFAANAQVAPAPGDLVVSEVMPNPGPDACVTDANGEYFELTNISCKVLDLGNLFVTDVTPGTTFFRILPGALPSLYPGQKYLFIRNGNTALNGNIANYNYAYADVATAPADNSKVASASGILMGNSSGGDGLQIAIGGPLVLPSPNPNGYVLGTLLDKVQYDVTKTPFTSSGSGQAGERKDLFSPMQLAGTANSANLALSTTVNTSCVGNTYVGTPGMRNSTDTSAWSIVNTTYDSVNYPNTGVLKALGPVSVGAGSIDFSAASGPAGQTLYFGYANDVGGTAEYSLGLLIPGNAGSINIDIFTASYLEYAFDGSGGSLFNVLVPNNPILVGQLFELQWLGLDPGTFTLIGSNGVRVLICP
ncbi:MAG: lamin tail domain-containing protein [Planctomycetes bacterium]|nr:lamin tail domain-containing protein [Planctomycetota bacterium]